MLPVAGFLLGLVTLIQASSPAVFAVEAPPSPALRNMTATEISPRAEKMTLAEYFHKRMRMFSQGQVHQRHTLLTPAELARDFNNWDSGSDELETTTVNNPPRTRRRPAQRTRIRPSLITTTPTAATTTSSTTTTTTESTLPQPQSPKKPLSNAIYSSSLDAIMMNRRPEQRVSSSFGSRRVVPINWEDELTEWDPPARRRSSGTPGGDPVRFEGGGGGLDPSFMNRKRKYTHSNSFRRNRPEFQTSSSLFSLERRPEEFEDPFAPTHSQGRGAPTRRFGNFEIDEVDFGGDPTNSDGHRPRFGNDAFSFGGPAGSSERVHRDFGSDFTLKDHSSHERFNRNFQRDPVAFVGNPPAFGGSFRGFEHGEQSRMGDPHRSNRYIKFDSSEPLPNTEGIIPHASPELRWEDGTVIDPNDEKLQKHSIQIPERPRTHGPSGLNKVPFLGPVQFGSLEFGKGVNHKDYKDPTQNFEVAADQPLIHHPSLEKPSNDPKQVSDFKTDPGFQRSIETLIIPWDTNNKDGLEKKVEEYHLLPQDDFKNFKDQSSKQKDPTVFYLNDEQKPVITGDTFLEKNPKVTVIYGPLIEDVEVQEDKPEEDNSKDIKYVRLSKEPNNFNSKEKLEFDRVDLYVEHKSPKENYEYKYEHKHEDDDRFKNHRYDPSSERLEKNTEVGRPRSGEKSYRDISEDRGNRRKQNKEDDTVRSTEYRRKYHQEYDVSSNEKDGRKERRKYDVSDAKEDSRKLGKNYDISIDKEDERKLIRKYDISIGKENERDLGRKYDTSIDKENERELGRKYDTSIDRENERELGRKYDTSIDKEDERELGRKYETSIDKEDKRELDKKHEISGNREDDLKKNGNYDISRNAEDRRTPSHEYSSAGRSGDSDESFNPFKGFKLYDHFPKAHSSQERDTSKEARLRPASRYESKEIAAGKEMSLEKPYYSSKFTSRSTEDAADRRSSSKFRDRGSSEREVDDLSLHHIAGPPYHDAIPLDVVKSLSQEKGPKVVTKIKSWDHPKVQSSEKVITDDFDGGMLFRYDERSRSPEKDKSISAPPISPNRKTKHSSRRTKEPKNVVSREKHFGDVIEIFPSHRDYKSPNLKQINSFDEIIQYDLNDDEEYHDNDPNSKDFDFNEGKKTGSNFFSGDDFEDDFGRPPTFDFSFSKERFNDPFFEAFEDDYSSEDVNIGKYRSATPHFKTRRRRRFPRRKRTRIFGLPRSSPVRASKPPSAPQQLPDRIHKVNGLEIYRVPTSTKNKDVIAIKINEFGGNKAPSLSSTPNFGQRLPHEPRTSHPIINFPRVNGFQRGRRRGAFSNLRLFGNYKNNIRRSLQEDILDSSYLAEGSDPVVDYSSYTYDYNIEGDNASQTDRLTHSPTLNAAKSQEWSDLNVRGEGVVTDDGVGATGRRHDVPWNIGGLFDVTLPSNIGRSAHTMFG